MAFFSNLLLVSLCFFSQPSSLAPHPFYIAVAEMNHNAKDKIIEVSCKMFADDFEQILEKNYNTQLDITQDKYKAAFDKYVPDYINKHLQVVVDGKAATLKYIGYEQEKGSAYCYFEIDNISSFKKISVTNSILFDFIDKQTNIIHVTENGTRKSSKLDFPEKNAEFSF
jgi:hypothetical protein